MDARTEHADRTALLARTPDVIARLASSHSRFLAFLERRVRSREVAEEILQEAFVRALAQAESLHDGEAAIAWFYRVLRNALVDHHRRGAAKQRALEAVAREPVEPAPAVDQELMDTVCACVNDLLHTLKPEYAGALRAVELDEASVAEYAAREGLTSNNAGVRLHRARKALGQALKDCCGTCATHGCIECSCAQARR